MDIEKETAENIRSIKKNIKIITYIFVISIIITVFLILKYYGDADAFRVV